MLNADIQAACERQARDLNVPVSYLLAFIEVESNGRVFIRGTTFPKIRWEGHYFYRRLEGDARAEAVGRRLASRDAGGIGNPRDQNARYSLLHDARSLCEKYDLDPDLANECISIGLGQVMGAHWRRLGYRNAAHMLDVAQEGAAAQIDMMIRYVREWGLLDALRRGDWKELAHGYNGPGYRKNRYDEKLEEAAMRYAAESPSGIVQYPILQSGSSGPFVQTLQNRLAELGYAPGSRDGHYGSLTRAAVLAFQADHGLRTDGVAGPATWTALETSKGRPLGESRRGASADDLRREGSSTVRGADAGAAGGVVLGGAGAAGTVVEHLDTAEQGVGLMERVQRALWPFWDTISDYLPMILIGVGVAVVWQMHRIRKARVEDHRQGRNLGR